MNDAMDYPCFVISSNGFKDSVSLKEDPGLDRFLGSDASTGMETRDIIKDFIRRHPDTNGLPLYFISDHGNIRRQRRVTLRKGMQR